MIRRTLKCALILSAVLGGGVGWFMLACYQSNPAVGLTILIVPIILIFGWLEASAQAIEEECEKDRRLAFAQLLSERGCR